MSPMRIPLQEDLDTLQATLMEEGEMCARAIRGAIQAVRERVHRAAHSAEDDLPLLLEARLEGVEPRLKLDPRHGPNRSAP